METIKIFFAQNFQNFIWLAVFILALLPITEGRIAFPFAINKSLLNNNVMSPPLALITCFLASVFLCLFLLYFFDAVSKFFDKFKFFNKMNEKINKIVFNKSQKFKGGGNIYFWLGFFVFIPLPLTGVWTACLISCFLNLDIKKSFVSIVVGNLLSLVLIYVLSLVFKNFTLVFILLCFAITFLVLIIKKLYFKNFKVKFLND